MDPISSILVIVSSLFLPPLGVAFISGCSVDFVINIALTMLGYLPGLLHALYLEYVYYSRREDAANGVINYDRAPGVYSEIIQRGGMPRLHNSDVEGGHIRLPDGPATQTAVFRDAAPAQPPQRQQQQLQQQAEPQQSGVYSSDPLSAPQKSVAELKEDEARRHAQDGEGSGAV
ncbi:uncharacterized protein V2V93DRAFT_365625 [Kockiozyma suomiensis]|uniref:uncharacterized protein n=1 Tax=Kockiozyma suomiensis TaxID=1337062 RepID=UPI003343F77F